MARTIFGVIGSLFTKPGHRLGTTLFREAAMSKFSTRLGLAGLALLAMSLAAGATEAVSVRIDQAKVMRIDSPASTVIIGNPSIADAVMQDTQTLVITGRGYGTTNFIVLDADGNAIADAQVNVQGANQDIVTIFRQGVGGRSTYSCVDVCEPATQVGDATDTFFNPILAQQRQRNTTAANRGVE
ncbi:pilus assembly protein N-terminal domain-containing protein [Methylobrevis pamukkalensis]|uniref:pilus assembly protein N-terminal domain-containing protein n=1 Tax=Methylobrevis pamukkalensis TaxID=1439726 RepID=UPI00147264E8|nr:pilus assembly protein N-terminal domain-containing protein [Methylobrevis pamukkalensis]